MLQSMQKKVESEGAKAKELYDKFMCYCKTSGATLGAGITAAETKIPAVGSSIKEAEAQKVGCSVALCRRRPRRPCARLHWTTRTLSSKTVGTSCPSSLLRRTQMMLRAPVRLLAF